MIINNDVNSGTNKHSSGNSNLNQGIQTQFETIDLKNSSVIPWMRYLLIEFKNKEGKTLRVGGYDDSLSISVKINKQLAIAADKATIKIYNYPYYQLPNFREGGFTYDVSIYAGYRNTNQYKLFSGGVIYYEGHRTDRNTFVLSFNCGCKLLSDRFQNVYSDTFSPGMNFYDIVNRVSEYYNVSREIYIDDCLKEDTIQYELSTTNDLAGWFNTVMNSSSMNRNYAMNNDSKNGTIGSFLGYKALNSGKVYKVNTRDIILESYPSISIDGLNLVLSPTYDITPGDIILLDNLGQGLIDVTSGNMSYSTYFSDGQAFFIDKDGMYSVRSIDYDLNNRSDSFNMTLRCISKNLFINKLLGLDNNNEKKVITSPRGGEF